MEQTLTMEELNETNGGAKLSATAIALIIGGIATFFVGVVNGYQRPLTCGSSK